jgi:hypothetical protein
MSYSVEELSKLANELVQEAEKHHARLRLLGGLAIFTSSPQAAAHPKLARPYKDLDFATDKKGAGIIPDVFADQGWEADRYFNALHGRTRLLFYFHGDLQADIFIGSFEQCHRLKLEKRLSLNSPALPLADLLMTKLQVHELNAKDVQDIFALLLAHRVDSSPAPEAIDLSYIAHITSDDWGWYTTINDNLDVLAGMVPAYLVGDDAKIVQARLKELCNGIETHAKTPRWQARNLIGRRMLWYDEPEEVIR